MNQIRTPQELIACCIERMGGLKALLSIRSLYCSSTRISNGFMTHVELYRAVGGRIRIEERNEDGHLSIIQINGLAGSRLEASSGKRSRMAQDEIASIKSAVRLYPRNFLAHAGEYQYEFYGVEDLHNRSCYVLHLPVERATYYYTEQFDCIQLVYASGHSVEFTDYREIDGLRTPFVERTRKASGEVEENRLNRVRYNLKLDASLFEWS